MIQKISIAIVLLFSIVISSSRANDKDFRGGNAIAIAEFQNKTDFGETDFAEKARDAFESSLFTAEKFVLVERKKLDAILKEIALGQTGLVDEKTLSRAGKLVSANLICTGAVESVAYSLNKRDRMKEKALSVFGITSRTDPFGVAAPDNYRSSWDIAVTVNIRIVDVEKGIIVFNKSMTSQALRIRLRQTTTAPVYDSGTANEILKPVMDGIVNQVADYFRK